MAKKVKAPAFPVPQTREAFEVLAVELGGTMREIDRINADVADKVAKAKLSGKERTLWLAERADVLWAAMAAYAEAHKDELLPKDRKSVAIAAGVIGWRLGQPRVVLADEDEVIEALEALGLDAFLRTKTEIDKAALLADREKAAFVTGVSIEQREELFFKPLDLDQERVRKAPIAREAA